MKVIIFGSGISVMTVAQ